MQFGEIRQHAFYIVERIRSVWVPRNLHPLPGVEVGINLFAQLLSPRLQPLYFLLQIQTVGYSLRPQFLYLFFQFNDRPFEIEMEATAVQDQIPFI